MPFNGSGSFSPPGADFPAVANTLIESTKFNNVINDIATGLSTCITVDGQSTVTNNIPFGGNRLTGIGAPVATGDAMREGSPVGGTTPAAGHFTDLTASGQTILGAAAPISTEKVSVQNGGNSVGLRVDNSNGALAVANIYSSVGQVAGSGYQHFSGVTDSGNAVLILGNGDIQNANNSYGAISDAKLKEGVTPAGSQWEDVKALAAIIRKFTIKSDPSKKVQIGWVAQEAQEVSPGLVYATPDMEEFEDTRINKLGKKESFINLRPVGTQTLAIRHSVAYLKAFKALGEALEAIEHLTQRVENLERAST